MYAVALLLVFLLWCSGFVPAALNGLALDFACSGLPLDSQSDAGGRVRLREYDSQRGGTYYRSGGGAFPRCPCRWHL